MRVWVLPLLVACGVSQESTWEGEPLAHVGPHDVGQVASPPEELTLQVTQLWPGEPATWRVTGLQPGERVRIARARNVGADTCLSVAGDMCIDLQRPPTLFDSILADSSGVAEVTRTVPTTVPMGRGIAFQAVAVRGTGGEDSVKSNAVLRVTRPAGFTETPFDMRPANPTCEAFERPASSADLQLEPVFSGVNLNLPVAMVQAPGDDSAWYAAELSGRIKRFDNDPATQSVSTALNFSSRVVAGSELGFLSLAFHPDFASNGYLYVYYTGGSFSSPESRISRFESQDGGLSFLPSSEQVILEVDQPASNHNGGTLLFGPDGYLYLSLGDGGSANDPWNNAQNTNNLLGAMLRIDVDGGSPYAVPADNPFAAGGGAPELFAWGLRNPYRWSFDRVTGDIWVGDVGQNAREEIDLVVKGGNYGWKVMEGTFCANPGDCSDPDFLPPVYEYAHGSGGQSVIGGYVYRGSEMPDLYGTYLFAEFYTGEISGLFYDAATDSYDASSLVTVPGLQISSFAEDASGELYVLDYSGSVYRVTNGSVGQSVVPQWLSQTGCFDPEDPSIAVDAMIPYEPAATLWSDGLTKERWFALPDGETIFERSNGDWTFPVGTVTAKAFRYQGELVETRLFVRHDDGEWGAYTYVWDHSVGDAYLVTAGTTVDLGPLTWDVPNQGECFACHTAGAGRSLGLESAQLKGDFDYGGNIAQQLSHLEDLGLFANTPVYPETLPSLDDVFAPAEDRARAYLHANCAMCHLPNGTGGSLMDLRWATGFADTETCNVVPVEGDLGIPGARIVVPGDASRSVLLQRMLDTGDARMPQLGTRLVHGEAADVVEDWINSLSTCP